MKKFILTLTLITALTFAGCKKEKYCYKIININGNGITKEYFVYLENGTRTVSYDVASSLKIGGWYCE